MRDSWTLEVSQYKYVQNESFKVRTHSAKLFFGLPVALPRRRHFTTERRHFAQEHVIQLEEARVEQLRFEDKLVDLVMRLS